MTTACRLTVLVALTAMAQVAQAADTPERVAIQADSRARILRQPVVAALERERGPGNAARLSALLDTLPAVARLDGVAKRRDDGEAITLVSSARWFVTVGSEGDHFDYLDDELANASVWDRAPAMPLDELIVHGKDMLDGPLASLIVLDPGEGLVAIRSQQVVRESRDSGGALVARTVAVNVIEFARTVNDIPVLGTGCRVRLGFSPLGRLVSVYADWPRYKAAPAQRFTVATPQTVARREASIRERYGIPISRAIRRFECGYLDNGRSSLLQPGCRVVVGREGDGEEMAFRIPAAEIPVNDPTWSEIGLLLKGGVP